MDHDIQSPFLNTRETRQLQGLYEEWIRTLKPNELIPKLVTFHVLSTYEREKVETISMPSEKSIYLFHNILMKATYEDMCKIRNALINSGQRGHILLAKMMPNRGGHIDFDQYYFPEQNYSDSYSQQSSDEGSDRNSQVSQQCSEDVDMRDEQYDELNLEPSSFMTDSDVQQSKPAAKNGGQQKNQRATPVSSTTRTQQQQRTAPSTNTRSRGDARPAASPDYTEYTPVLPCYGVKKKSNKSTGNGLCVIFRNFTRDLTGYKQDEKAIVRFFGDKLKYKVWAGEQFGLVDLCKREFKDKLRHVQQHLINPFEGSAIDRFFLFILSHGDEKGIKMCKEGSQIEEEVDGNGEPERVAVDEITEMFSHDKVDLLKGFPKCFFIQACQGTKVAQSAARGDMSQMTQELQRVQAEEDAKWNPPAAKIAVGADIMVCLPSERGTYSWVPSTGSWFIQETMAIFEKHYTREHLVDLMIGVNHALSKREGRGRETDDSPTIQVRQMPGLSCSLTKKFFLSIPQIKPYTNTDEDE